MKPLRNSPVAILSIPVLVAALGYFVDIYEEEKSFLFYDSFVLRYFY